MVLTGLRAAAWARAELAPQLISRHKHNHRASWQIAEIVLFPIGDFNLANHLASITFRDYSVTL